MRKQSLDERYNTYAVKFMRNCFEHLLSNYIVTQKRTHEHFVQNASNSFKRILIRDSTSLLPKPMQAFYPGKTVSKTAAAIKIDYMYDYLSGRTEQLVLESGREPDSKLNTVYQPVLQAQDLLITDLGYWNIRQFENYDKAGIYFLSRLKTDALISEKDIAGNYQQVSIEKYLTASHYHVVHVGLGTNHLPLRLYIEKLPEQAALARRDKLQKLAKSQGWQLSPLRIKLCDYNLFITNAPEEKLPDAFMYHLYTLRWQIELMFRTWKSQLKIDKIERMSIFRFECMLYGRLILMLINNQLQSSFKNFVLWKKILS